MCPLTGLVVDDPESIELVLRKKIFGVVVFFWLLESAEEVVSFADSDDRMSRSRCRFTTFLLDLVPSDRQGHRDQRIKR